MRLIVAATAAVLLAFSSNPAARADKVEVKGVHLCCGSCVKAVGSILGKVEGVSDVNCDRKTQTVTFTAKDAPTAAKAFVSLTRGGFYGKATTDGGKVLQTKNEAGSGKAKQVTVSDVHACCGSCKVALQKLFKGAKVTVEGKGAQRTVIIAGENLEPAAVLETLRSGGFNGAVRKE
jgi:copper chaperone CopZ